MIGWEVFSPVKYAVNGFNSRHTCGPDLPIYLQNDDGIESYAVHEGKRK